jgi:hypothetical protein
MPSTIVLLPAYGTLVAWAKAMGHTQAARILTSILEEEKAADEKLNRLAEGGINQQAAANASDDEQAQSNLTDSIKRAVFGSSGTAATAASRSRKSAARKAAPARSTRKTSGRKRR